MDLKYIRNFSIVAHIDHGKSTLADRMLEITGTIEKRKMRAQFLDMMELERERGITIKMQPVRMEYTSLLAPLQNSGEGKNSFSSSLEKAGDEVYILNLIDTPGHIDFSYEVSRALKAVEGTILLVDATQGVQAQTFSVLEIARAAGLKIIPVVSKIDSPLARIPETKAEVARLLNCRPEDVLEVSGKTGEGVNKLLEAIVQRIPLPTPSHLPLAKGEVPKAEGVRALIFDFKFSDHRGVIVYTRVFDGRIQPGDRLRFCASGREFKALEVGVFSPQEKPCSELSSGEIGYVVTGIKEPGGASVGDTLSTWNSSLPALAGYDTPRPVVWASIYPEGQDDFNALRSALERLHLSDASLSFEEESSGALGRGFRCGFLGMLHLEIVAERLRREFNLNLITTTPTIAYRVTCKVGFNKNKQEVIYSPSRFPDEHLVLSTSEPWVKARVIAPNDRLGAIMPLFHEHEAEVGETQSFGEDRSVVNFEIPLRELMRGFFDELKSVSSGFASIAYEPGDFRPADVVRLDILVAEEPVQAFARVVPRRRAELEAEKVVDKLKTILPRQLFTLKIQAQALGRILASRSLPALKKDVTGYLYGGDRTRKMKLWKKQKEGKKRLRARGRVNIPHEVFLKMMRG